MHEEIIISGFGGQGVLFAGQLLAYAGVADGLHVTWIPSYGPEMRGGTAHCEVVISSEEIGSPLTAHPTAAIILNSPSMEKYEPLVKAGGLLLLDSSLVPQGTTRHDVREIALPAKEIAAEFGMPQAANMVMVGALAAATGIVRLETLERVLKLKLGERHAGSLEANLRALRCGAVSAKESMPV
ncbi:MAG: 2-oxoacid:acceptor oxidoreductase family protein [Chloroflexota bacterium]